MTVPNRKDIEKILNAGREGDLYEILSGTSPFSEKTKWGEDESLETIKLVSAVKRQLLFVSKYGHERNHVEEGGTHYFSHPEKIEEWLEKGAPGIIQEEISAYLDANPA
ncbi:hypothetical protein A3194_12580 [Candidatus Thiodiazotropha endoloripes]|uniref:hypothetical protein n=1 Tax=Candidatus Thiodiazotropha endoloripes TaxID=1818881 RepID=UPI00083D8D3D|nr:hypothetical protein [Candidatus Thiodiazotropha endoloripes]ODB85663.1 hypothetical protein A3194_12580 [Candidatus Thiodiazotropha endoloripes]